jgi:thioredoxin
VIDFRYFCRCDKHFLPYYGILRTTGNTQQGVYKGRIKKYNSKLKMKQFVLLLLITGLWLTACGQTKKSATEEPAKKENKMKTIRLNKIDFLKKVVDYESNPNDWKYLGDKPALIDFYADWCGPCKVVAPVLEELAKEYDGKIYIYKIDTEAERELAAVFGIRSIPSLLFVPMNGMPQMAQGALPKSALKEAIDKVLLEKQ